MAATQDTLATFGNVNYANPKQLITKVPGRSGLLTRDQHAMARPAFLSIKLSKSPYFRPDAPMQREAPMRATEWPS
jgi:hypothetical protein